MLRLIADENFNNDIVRSLKLASPDLDLVRVQDVGLRKKDDPTILEWAAREGRILLTHDIRTIPHFAYERVRDGLVMPGVLEIPRTLSIGSAIADIMLLAQASNETEWQNQVIFLPLR